MSTIRRFTIWGYDFELNYYKQTFEADSLLHAAYLFRYKYTVLGISVLPYGGMEVGSNNVIFYF